MATIRHTLAIHAADQAEYDDLVAYCNSIAADINSLPNPSRTDDAPTYTVTLAYDESWSPPE